MPLAPNCATVPGIGLVQQSCFGRSQMMRLALVSALFVSAMAIGANAGPKLGGEMPDKPVDNLLMIYNTDPALQCYHTAMDGIALRDGLDHCNTAVLDPLINYRAETFVNRG